MADLDVQPKRTNPWWLWLLIALIAISILFFMVRGCSSKHEITGVADSTKIDSTKTAAATRPDWDKVDFNAAKSSDADVTDSGIKVSGNDKYTIYTLGENILFATNQNALRGDAGTKLKQIAASLNKRYKGATIGVFGSTDSTGTAGHNKMLGGERAAAVKNWLITTGGLDSTKVSVHSLGESKPVASNSTAAGRQQNRNVSIVAFPNK